MADPFREAPPRISTAALAEIAATHFDLNGPITPLGGERDQNVRIDARQGRFTLKVMNPAETASVVDLQQAILTHLAATDPTLPVPRLVMDRAGRSPAVVEVDGTPLLIWVITHLDGTGVAEGPLPDATSRSIGAMAARLQRGLRGLFHPAAGRRHPWDARSAADVANWTASIPDTDIGGLARQILSASGETVAALIELPAQVVHHDLNRDNLLVAGADPSTITGVVDFGDAIHAPRIADLAVAVSYAILEHPAPQKPAAAVLSGYAEHAALEPAELDVLPGLVALRLAQSLAIGSRRAELHPENTRYLLADHSRVAAALEAWTMLDHDDLAAYLADVVGIPGGASPDLVERRSAAMWSGLRLSYESPLHLVRGNGVWLDDAAGRRYLDAYNNVVQVGHGNRRVIAAATHHAEQLNTNTRYLTDPVVSLAEDLTERLPDPLEVCFVVSSGSEANDLAWRIATAVTGHAGAIVTDHAYHGWTAAVYALSPEERPAAEAPDTVVTVAPPGVAGRSVDEAVAALSSRGHAPAAVWFDTTFSSDGVYAPPANYLTGAAAAVRRSGGLVIADEVQAGLGRVGSRYWGFAVENHVPDIATLGKPLGNGYPIGAVVTTRAIADQFGEAGYFFSTFGGNPVCAAAARMVLRITDDEQLPDRAEAVGALLRRELPEALSPIGMVAVRGRGSLIGVDVGDGDLAQRLVEATRRAGALIGRTGPGGTVLKLRPPLVFDDAHAVVLLEAIAEAARAVAG